MFHILNYCHICKDVVSASRTTFDAPRAVVDHVRTVHPRSKMAKDPRIKKLYPSSAEASGPAPAVAAPLTSR